MYLKRYRRLKQLALLLALPAVPATACSMVGCIDHGIELKQNFELAFTHQGKALPGVTVKVTDVNANIRFSGIAPSTGSPLKVSLPPGDYWLNADFLGIKAAYECFHVPPHPSRHAKRRLSYQWGDLAPATRHIAGKLVDSQNATGGTPIWNVTHRVKVPIAKAKLRLENPITRRVYSTMSDGDGAFAFDEVPAGIYALHIEGGGSSRSYEATDLLLELNQSAKKIRSN